MKYLSVSSVAHRVTLRILEGDSSHYEISHSTFGQVLIFADNVLEQIRRYFGVITSLLQSHTEYCLLLHQRWCV